MFEHYMLSFLLRMFSNIQIHYQLHSLWHCIEFMINLIGFRVGSKIMVAREKDRNSEIQKVNTQNLA